MYRNISCRQVVAPNFSIVQVNICGPFTGATRDRPPCWCTEGGLFYFSCIGKEICLSSAAGVVAPQMNQFPFEAAEEVCCKDSPLRAMLWQILRMASHGRTWRHIGRPCRCGRLARDLNAHGAQPQPVRQESPVAFSSLHSQKGKRCGAHPEKYGKIYMPLTDCVSTIGETDLRPARRFCRPSGRRSLLILKRQRQEFYKNFLKTAEKLHVCVQLLAGNGVWVKGGVEDVIDLRK